MPAFNVTDPVSVGLSTKADHYHRVFDNTLALLGGEIGIAGAAAGDDPYFSTATQLSPGARQLRQTFRGLTLRTHPDADVAAYKVYLDHADEIVMHDGTRVADWDDLAADITASGANGLDTGTEGASRWYEIHAIRKSSDGTKGLLLHRAKNYLNDQSQTTNSADRALRYATGTPTDKLAQGITFATAGVLPFVEVSFNRYNAVTGNVWFTLETDNAGNPSGTVVAISDKIDGSIYSTSALQWTQVVFRSLPTVTASLYHLVMQGDYTRADGAWMYWSGNAASSYAGGSAKEFNGATWSAATGVADFAFNAYVIQNSADVTMPSGYDQRCHIGWVYNDSGSNLTPMRAKDRLIRHYGVAVSAGSALAATLVDTSALHPPAPVVMVSSMTRGDTSGQDIYISSEPTTNTAVADYAVGLGSGYWTMNGNAVFVEFQRFYYKTQGSASFIYPISYRW